MTTYQNPILTVDTVLLALFGDRVKVALMQRTNPDEPEFGKLALPGGFVRIHEGQDNDTQDAMLRVLRDKLGFVPSRLEQVFTQSGRTRDPRGWSASVVHVALHTPDVLQQLADEGKVQLFDVVPQLALPDNLAFDHAELVAQAVDRVRAKAAYTTIVAHFLPRVFTFTELHQAFEVVCQRAVNPANLRRKIDVANVLKESKMLHSIGRPAQGYTLRKDIHFFDRQVA